MSDIYVILNRTWTLEIRERNNEDSPYNDIGWFGFIPFFSQDAPVSCSNADCAEGERCSSGVCDANGENCEETFVCMSDLEEARFDECDAEDECPEGFLCVRELVCPVNDDDTEVESDVVCTRGRAPCS